VKQGRSIPPRPFLKWAGGKGQLLDELIRRVDKAAAFGRYHEPFVGGGALFFEMVRQGRLTRKPAYLSDSNQNLVDAYQGLKEDVQGVIRELTVHKARHSEPYYYEVRATIPDTPVGRAARIIYLNRTCYNGLFRENSRGEFNVPFGKYKNPMICDEANLRACAEALWKAKVEARHFETVLEYAEAGDFVYFDPPYVPLSRTSSFTAYGKGGFSEGSQRRLAEVFQELDRRGVKVLLSNSMTDLVKNLYAGYVIEEVLAKRSVNSRADRRGKISEALVRNF
jgi:DNA adenine methylase